MKQQTTKETRADRHIIFTLATVQKLETYLSKYYKNHRAMSMIVDKAVEEYLDRHKKDGEL
ncbi:MAG TPA: hypothetical protein VMW50_14860 [Dehalococcoidia bacterium]|nr:hypothetical protein [Dehalococcoidia bacterium]